MNLPTFKEIEALHKKYAPSDKVFNDVWEHVSIVWAIAEELIAKHPDLELNPQLVKIGCLLHDIGVYHFYDDNEQLNADNYITHGLVGYKILKDEHYPDLLCDFPRNHIGVGVTKEDIRSQQLPLPLKDYTPQTIEQRLVAFADKFHSKTDPATFNSKAYYKKFLSEKFGDHKVKIFEAMLEEFGEPDLPAIMKQFNYPADRIR